MMKPVAQTKLHNPETRVKGNCMAAALASLLELPIEAVPPFEEMESADVDIEWRAWDDFHWWRALLTWLYLFGYDVECHVGEPKWNEWPELVLASVESPRFPGTGHTVIMNRDGLVWDPHPDSDGTFGAVWDYWIITKREPATWRRKTKQSIAA